MFNQYKQELNIANENTEGNMKQTSELKEKMFISWDIAKGTDEWCVQLWKKTKENKMELLTEINKDSDDGGSFDLSQYEADIRSEYEDKNETKKN